ncbi:MAG: hypothetical protein ACOC4F_02775 [bacterium]
MGGDRIRAREVLLMLSVAGRILLPVLLALVLTVLAGYGLFLVLFG